MQAMRIAKFEQSFLECEMSPCLSKLDDVMFNKQTPHYSLFPTIAAGVKIIMDLFDHLFDSLRNAAKLISMGRTTTC